MIERTTHPTKSPLLNPTTIPLTRNLAIKPKSSGVDTSRGVPRPAARTFCVLLAGPKRGGQWAKAGSWTQGEKRGCGSQGCCAYPCRYWHGKTRNEQSNCTTKVPPSPDRQ
eukprot:4071645-Pyramimonas_sp.AAC.1